MTVETEELVMRLVEVDARRFFPRTRDGAGDPRRHTGRSTRLDRSWSDRQEPTVVQPISDGREGTSETPGDRGGSPRSRRSAAAKRLTDIVVGGVLAVVTIPIVLLLCLAAVATFRHSPFFVQTRVGRWGVPMRVLKIRSLPVTVGPSISKYDLDNGSNTRFGRFVRRTHLDELPQLWLVFAGKMSLVGPRPEMPHLEAHFSSAQARARAPFRSGCTGLWQLSVDAPRLMEECPEYDVFYARHQSVRMDLWVLWRTVLFHALGRTVALERVPRWISTPRPGAGRAQIGTLSAIQHDVRAALRRGRRSTAASPARRSSSSLSTRVHLGLRSHHPADRRPPPA